MSQERLRQLAPGGSATFTFECVIAGKDPNTAGKTHQSLQRVCSTIIDAFSVSNDTTKSPIQKREALLSVAALDGDLEWLPQWADDEAQHCLRYDANTPLVKIASTVSSQASSMRRDIQSLSSEPQRFPLVFDVMLAFLEQMTEFLKQRHAAEVTIVIDQGKNAYAEAHNLHHIEVPSLLVPQSRLMKERTENFHQKCVNLVNIQDGSNKVLKSRAENVGNLLSSAIPDFILKSKDRLTHMDNNSFKEQQTESYNALISCLDEINKILDRVRAKFTNSFEQEDPSPEADLSELDDSVDSLFRNLAKLRVPDEQVKAQATEFVHPLTKTVIGSLSQAGAPVEAQREVLAAVKSARDGSIPDFFTAVDKVDDIVQQVQAMPRFEIPVVAPVPTKAPGDMLEAAKAMCAALKGLSFSLDV